MKIKFVPVVFLCCFFLLPALRLHAQTDTLILQVEPAEPKGVHLYWLPRTAQIWEKGNALGYRLTRSVNGGKEQVLINNTLPKDRAWFQSNKEAAYNMMPLVGEVLYDPDFRKELGDKTTALETRFSYLVYEGEHNIDIAKALGLGFTDTLWTDRGNTRYEVTLTENGRAIARGAIVLEADQLPIGRAPLSQVDYKLPDNKPLSMLRGDNGFDNTDYLSLDARAYGDSVVLRWAPNRSVSWANAMLNGYTLSRYNLETEIPEAWRSSSEQQLGDSLKQRDPDVTVLVQNLKPWAKETLNRPDVLKDTMALAAAQCLYGKREANKDSDVFSAWSESEMRFSFAMLAADRSALAADMLGLRWVDRTAKPGKNYMYLLECPGFLVIAGSPSIMVQNVKPDSLYRPREVYAIPGDKCIRLAWSTANDQHFSVYRVERSDDGGASWHLRSAPAMLQTANPEDPEPTETHYYLDSVPDNYKTYYYRLSGMDAFASWSEGTVVRGRSMDLTPNGEPYFTYAGLVPTGGIALAWSVDLDTMDLSAYELTVARDIEGGYVKIADSLPATQKNFYYEGPITTDRSYYFIVTTIDTAGNRHASLPVFVQVVDTIPPEVPVDISGKIDSNGVVTLVWKHNTETDLAGYRVYFGNVAEEEFSQLTPQAIPVNMYQDTVDLNTTTEFVFYRLVAEDRMHNLSPFSRILALHRPDKIAPITPVMQETVILPNGLRVKWSPSPNIDVIWYEVYRRGGGQDTVEWNKIQRVFRDSLGFTDTTARLEVLYEYSVRAVDDANLYSGYAFPAYGRLNFTGKAGSINTLKARYEPAMQAISLNWQFNESSIPADLRGQAYYFFLYRSLAGEDAYEKYQQLTGKTRNYTDRGLPADGNYRYMMKIVFADGKSGDLSDEAMVEVKKGK